MHEVTFHTEDIEDSICVVRSMTEFGLPIADDMIKDINHSLHTMSSSQPKRGYSFYNLYIQGFFFSMCVAPLVFSGHN